MKHKLVTVFNNIVTVAIMLVLVQTFLEEILVVMDTAWKIRKIFIFTGLFFDFFFTVEFLIRAWNALSQKQFRRYFFHENGWVDLIASIPLLVFSSAPETIAVLKGTVFTGAGSILGTLKVVKTVRLARMLRILRALKLFRRIRFANSVMAQRHTVRLATTVATTLIFSSMLIGVGFSFLNNTMDIETAWELKNKSVETILGDSALTDTPGALAVLTASQPSLFLLKYDGEVIYASFSEDYMRKHIGPIDFTYLKEKNYEAWIDSRPQAVSHAIANLIAFFSVLLVMIAIMITYSPHFALTVSDPINVMQKGFKEKSFNSEVKIPQTYSEDEIFRLAHSYNDNYLPLKEKGDATALDISLEDIDDIFKK